MASPSYMRSVDDRNVFKRRVPVHSMTFAQRRNCLPTNFSERIPVVKRTMSVFTFIFFIEILFGKSGKGNWQLPSAATIFTHFSSTDTFLYMTAPEGTPSALYNVRNAPCYK